MIHYALMCDRGHGFDGWFRDSAAYDNQAGRGLVACTVCGSAKVEKQVMAPGIPVKANKTDSRRQKMVAGAADPRMQMLMETMRGLRKQVEANADYVGDKFAGEARKIHYAEAEKRGIYGEATAGEARALIEEGIEVHPLPRLPEDGN